MSLNKEIERKWLIDKSKIPFNLEECESLRLKQGYISFSPTIRIRSENDTRFVLCVKTKPAPGSLSRDEFECDITEGDYNTLLTKTEGIIIEKTRYLKKDEYGYLMEIDIFEGALEGLSYMEIEFPSQQEAVLYKTPEWALKDVSCEGRYKNAALAKYGRLEPDGSME